MESTIAKFLETLNTIKIYHWKTRSYAEHIASDSLHAKLSANVDRFAEVYLGSVESRFDFSSRKTLPFVEAKGKKGISDRVKELMDHMASLKLQGDLSNIREDIIADCNQFIYLLSFDK
jgi:hypothetical protein